MKLNRIWYFVILFHLSTNILSSFSSINNNNDPEKEVTVKKDNLIHSILSVHRVHLLKNELKMYWDESSHSLHQFGIYPFNRIIHSIK